MSDCSKHKKEVAGITDMKVLAEMIGDLHYETLKNLLRHLADKIDADSEMDMAAGKRELGGVLYEASVYISNAQLYIKKAWQISKPFMDDKPTTHAT